MSTPEHRPAAEPAEPVEPVDAEIVEAEPVTAEPWAPPSVATDYTDQGVPTLDYVRDKIEGRSATAMGWEELRTAEVEEAEQKFAEREQKGKDKLAEIRRQMGL
ncbi:hypothetical protein [Pseudonocardia sp. WMMC193]|uniref:hypothetical protein n=1 Tax=Pseudonocardia sp. WMMC193 TaxID=2911965 RepID=UPI001F32E6E7|nr:hypothetical protein [Pseudonocardia sp. WMMC193]MCF7550021.1 hypothetical protein [Pseudonocardia sp. WMMC193]